MKDFIESLKNMESETLMLLVFAVVLLIFLLVLIVITIKVLKSSGEDEDEELEDEIDKLKKGVTFYDDDDDEDEDDEEEDETSKKIKEAVESVEKTKAKVEAERLDKAKAEMKKAEEDEAKQSAKARVEEIAKAVHDKNSPDSEDEYNDEVDENEPTGKLDSVKIEEELKKVRKESEESLEELNEAAKQRAESPDYNASFDSAFVDKPSLDEEKAEPVIPNPTPESVLGSEASKPGGDTLDATEEAIVAEAVKAARSEKITVNPVNEVHINTVNTVGEVDTKNDKAGISGVAEMKEFMKENPEPKVKKRKVKKKDKVFEDKFETHADEIKTAKFFWYNTQDIEGLTRKEDMYFKCHYFESADDAILDLITEMYDCAFVRTEQLQRIAYGITFKSMGMKEILKSEEDLGFNKNSATKEPTESDKEEIYTKWCGYVDNFMKIIVINAPKSVKQYIVEKMYDYGHKDVEELMYSPY